jgi:predicted dehydrogenase
MTSDVLRIAIIGAGSIGRDRIALIQASAMIRLAGICDPADHAVAIAVAAKTSLYHDIESLIQTETPDGIIIASPNGLHAEHARACAAHNIPMLIEKPIAGTLQDARQIELLDATILVGHFRRFNPLVAECRSMLDEGAIGKPIGVSAMNQLAKMVRAK